MWQNVFQFFGKLGINIPPKTKKICSQFSFPHFSNKINEIAK
jgi:hypothetical protein